MAKQLTTLDHLSGGRAVLGVGLGEPAGAEFADFGEPDGARERADRLDEGLTVLDGLLQGPVEHQGTHFSVRSELFPRPVQEPRPPIWIAGIAPHRRPLERAARWEGLVPLAPDGVLTPNRLADYVADLPHRPPGWEVVVPAEPGIPVDEYADAGATWLVASTDPDDGWVDRLRGTIQAGASGTR